MGKLLKMKKKENGKFFQFPQHFNRESVVKFQEFGHNLGSELFPLNEAKNCFYNHTSTLKN